MPEGSKQLLAGSTVAVPSQGQDDRNEDTKKDSHQDSPAAATGEQRSTTQLVSSSSPASIEDGVELTADEETATFIAASPQSPEDKEEQPLTSASTRSGDSSIKKSVSIRVPSDSGITSSALSTKKAEDRLGHGNSVSRRSTGSVCFASENGMSFEFTRVPSTSSLRSQSSGVSVDASESSLPRYLENAFIGFLATLLAFNSGFSNGVCLSGLIVPDDLFNRMSVSGYTGTYTQSALAVADLEMTTYHFPRIQFIGFNVCMILSFILGSCIAGLLNPRPAPWRLAPTFAPALLLGCIFMAIGSVLANTIKQAGEGIPHFFFFVALANGIQNGVSSMYSANLIRTTHLTGTSTDIGLFVGQLIRGNTNNTWKLGVLCSLALSFWIGSFVSFYAVRRFARHALIINAAIFFFLLFLYIAFIMTNLHLPLHRALRGTWHWHRIMYRLKFRDATDGAAQPEEVLLAIFHEMDLDQDGFLDMHEFEEGLREHGLSYGTRDDLVHMFEVCDRDRDGKISPEDWLSLIKGDNVLVG